MAVKPAIVAVGYNRPDSMERLLKSIGNATYIEDNITLIVSIDKSNISEQVEKVAKDFNWIHGKKIIRCFEKRQGLKKHIIQCGDYSLEYGSAIILEDDLVVSPNFYQYVQSGLSYYEDEKINRDKIAGISLYSHQWNGFASRAFTPIQNGLDVYLGQFSISWGQCWSASQWKQFKDWLLINDGILKNNDIIPERITAYPETSWGKYFAHFMAEKDKYYIIPYVSLSTNFTEVGQHSSEPDNVYQVPLLYGSKEYVFDKLDSLIKYDMFFELLPTEFDFGKKIRENGVTIDFYGIKNIFLDTQFLLTSKILPYKIIESYGLLMRPQEINVLQNVHGEDIFLYDLTKNLNAEKNINNKFRMIKYEVRGLYWYDLLKYSLMEFRKAFLRKFKSYSNKIS